MENLRRQRAPVRRGFTKSVIDLEVELDSETKTRMSVQQMFGRVIHHREKLTTLDKLIDQALLDDNASEEELCEEYDVVTDYLNKFSDVEIRTQTYLELKSYDSSEYNAYAGSQREIVTKNQYRLPKLEFKKFNGDAKEWLGFWSQFKQIDKDEVMSPEEKFQYLIQATASGSKAREVVESFPPSAENYPKVICYLKERFGKEEILLEVYVRELLRLVLKNAVNPKDQSSILTLYDKLETQLRALETLGVTSDKFAAMLYPLVESCLLEEILRTWERIRSQVTVQAGVSKDRLSLLMEFLKSEVEGEVRISMARDGFGVENDDVRKNKSKFKKKTGDEIPTATDLFNGQQEVKKIPCIFCDKNHPSQDCFQAPKLSSDEKKKLIQEKRACFICLKPGHISKKCKATHIRCQVCQKKHYVAMCPELKTEKKEDTNRSQADGTVLSNQNCTSEVLLQTLLVRVSGKNGNRIIRALIDSGSQKSYVSTKAVSALGLDTDGFVEMAHNLFGGERTKPTSHRILKIHVENLTGTYSCKLSVLDQPIICGRIPRLQNNLILEELKSAGIAVGDWGEGQPEINLLIGADVYGKLLTGRIHPTSCGPVAVETSLGWTIMGQFSTSMPTSDSTLLVTSMVVSDASLTELWKLDTLGITDATDSKSREELEQAAMDYFHATTTRLPDGRYEVSLPWIAGHPELPSNEEIAFKRLVSATKKLEAIDRLVSYQNVFDDWLAEGIIEEVPEDELTSPGHYLPHRAVIKETSETTKVRPVFDASCKSSNSASLNDCLEKGRNLLELIPKIIIGFRLHRHGLISDIEKAFLQISLKKEERDFLRFLWWEKGTKQLKKYRHCRVVFGVSSSPFLLAATLKSHLERMPEDLENDAIHLLKCLYVDNCVTSKSSMSEAQEFLCVAMQMMSEAKFNLRGWVWNDPDDTTSTDDKKIPVLGLLWNVKKDTLQLDFRDFDDEDEKPITKRQILSTAHRLFDPIGFSCPVSLYPKIILQEAWKIKIGWDKELPSTLVSKFLEWKQDLPLLKEVTIPRWFLKENVKRNNWTLHVFTDASKLAYAAVVFLRAVGHNGVNVQLLQAKSRVAPVKQVSIPRLELLGCCIGARLAMSVKSDLEFIDLPTFYWTDSSNALCWIQRNDEWATFVGNRVREIRELTDPAAWRHISGTLNPADLPSRGCSAKRLLQSKWWEGPDWLLSPPEAWPKSAVNADEDVVLTERRKTVACHVAVEDLPWYVGHFSKYSRIVRMIAWIQRFKFNCQNKANKVFGDLIANEISTAELALVKIVQKESFGTDGSKQKDLLRHLNAVQDEKGIWRLKTKIYMRKDSSLFRSPMLLLAEHRLVELLIVAVHEELNHCGVQLLMSKIWEKFWITKSRKSIKKVISRCVKCRRFQVKEVEAFPAPLPEDRVRDAQVFEVVGIDLAGPLYLKDKPKSWVVLFTCAVYRAVHIELVSSLSTECFLQSFRRFVGRRGRPKIVYTDNGKNFVGSCNLMKKFDWEKIQNSKMGSAHVLQPVIWRFNPPNAPWWGGWWERIIRILKEILRKVLGRACLDYEEMLTVLCDCESIINDRPLTYVSEDIEDLMPLRPSMFLQEIRTVGVPDLDILDATAFNKRLQYRQKLRQDFRKRFRSEYLGMLHHGKIKGGKFQDIKIGDVVLVGNDAMKRLDWLLAVVVEVYPGKDGTVRVAKLKTSAGEFGRPIQRLYPLEVCAKDRETFVAAEAEEKIMDQESPVKEAANVDEVAKVTRGGRKLITPMRFRD